MSPYELEGLGERCDLPQQGCGPHQLEGLAPWGNTVTSPSRAVSPYQLEGLGEHCDLPQQGSESPPARGPGAAL